MKPKTPTKPKYKFSYVTAVEVRDVMMEAVKNMRGSAVKISYPRANGLQIDVEYSDVKSLFEFAKHFGAIMQTIRPDALQKVKSSGDCDFFLCMNCRSTDKKERNNVIRNLCNYCAVTHHLVNNDLLERAKDAFLEKTKTREPPPIVEVVKPEIKKPTKRINPIKLKHQK